MADNTEKNQEPQAEAPVEQTPRAEESKKKQKKDDGLKKQVLTELLRHEL